MKNAKDKRKRLMSRAQAVAIARRIVSKLDPEAAKRIYSMTSTTIGFDLQTVWMPGRKKEFSRRHFRFYPDLTIELTGGKVKGLCHLGLGDTEVYGHGHCWAKTLRRFLKQMAFSKYQETLGGLAEVQKAMKSKGETVDDICRRELTELGFLSEYEKAIRDEEEFNARFEARRKPA